MWKNESVFIGGNRGFDMGNQAIWSILLYDSFLVILESGVLLGRGMSRKIVVFQIRRLKSFRRIGKLLKNFRGKQLPAANPSISV